MSAFEKRPVLFLKRSSRSQSLREHTFSPSYCVSCNRSFMLSTNSYSDIVPFHEFSHSLSDWERKLRSSASLPERSQTACPAAAGEFGNEMNYYPTLTLPLSRKRRGTRKAHREGKYPRSNQLHHVLSSFHGSAVLLYPFCSQKPGRSAGINSKPFTHFAPFHAYRRGVKTRIGPPWSRSSGLPFNV